MKDISEKKAKKHVDISINIKKLIENLYPEWKTCLATHPTGRPGPTYKKLEEQSGEEFWSLHIYNSKTPSRRSRIKYPDIVVVKNSLIKYVIEVKWGFIGNYTNSTDLMKIFEEKEMNEIKNMTDKTQRCEAIGPKVYRGTRVKQNNKYNFIRNEETRFLLVSDFMGLYNNQRSVFDDFKKQFSSDFGEYKDKFIILDIEESVEDIQSIRDYMKTVVKISY